MLDLNACILSVSCLEIRDNVEIVLTHCLSPDPSPSEYSLICGRVRRLESFHTFFVAELDRRLMLMSIVLPQVHLPHRQKTESPAKLVLRLEMLASCGA